MADLKAQAPAIVQNLNMASDLYGDRSNIRNPYDLGVQLFVVDASHTFKPQRTLNTHLLNGETELRPGVGTNFVATFNWSSFLPKGFASDQFYYAVTAIGITPVQFAKCATASGVGNEAQMTGSGLILDKVAAGADQNGNVLFPGQLLGQVYRATMATAWGEYKQDGRKTAFVFDHLLNIPSTTAITDAASVGMPLLSNRAMLPVPFLLSPRNTNQSQEIIQIHFELETPAASLGADNAIYDLSEIAVADDLYALVYRIDFSGYFCDASGNPANQEYTLASAAAAASFQPVHR
jgi:hypothetical protein